MKKITQLSELALLAPMLLEKPQQVKVLSQGVKTFYSQTNCVYYHSALLFYTRGMVSGYTDFYRSQNSFLIMLENNLSFEQSGNFRFYLKAPTYQEMIEKKNYPEKLDYSACEQFAKAEYALLSEKTYYLQLKKESYYLPPTPPEFKPREKQTVVLYLSDCQAFSDDLAVPGTNWTY